MLAAKRATTAAAWGAAEHLLATYTASAAAWTALRVARRQARNRPETSGTGIDYRFEDREKKVGKLIRANIGAIDRS